MAVGPFQPAEVAALAEPDTRDEEAHGALLRLHGSAGALKTEV
jgi:hypothetical protein